MKRGLKENAHTDTSYQLQNFKLDEKRIERHEPYLIEVKEKGLTRWKEDWKGTASPFLQ